MTGLDIDWYGDPKYNLWAVLVATGWQHAGYIMLLYLAGLKAVDPALREAAAVDGASQVQTFFQVVFPVMRPINLIVLVVTVISALRAFDIVWIVNKGRNGLEIIAALVTQNIVGEASRIGFGSALATIMLVISSVFVVIYLNVRDEGSQVSTATSTDRPSATGPAGSEEKLRHRPLTPQRMLLHVFLIIISLSWLFPSAGRSSTPSAITTSPRPTDTFPSADSLSTTTPTRGSGVTSPAPSSIR